MTAWDARAARRSLQTQNVFITRTAPLCGEPIGCSSCDGALISPCWACQSDYEYEALCEMDDGEVCSARIVTRDDEAEGRWRSIDVVPPVLVELTPAERLDAAERYAEARRDHEEACREDAADHRREMEMDR